MLKVLVHFARHSERALERRHQSLQQGASQLQADADQHLEFLNDALVELQARMARTRTVSDAAARLTTAKA